MKTGSIRLLVSADDIHQYVLGLWTDGPIKQSHASGGLVHGIIEKFARLPRFFYEPSDQSIEWTHFSTWWGGILLCDYDNRAIRDLRYLHEIYHAATMPYVRHCDFQTLEAKNFANEREASTFTEMAIYLEFPELRQRAFAHPLFVDRFLFPHGNLDNPDARLLQRWKTELDLVLQELMYERARAVALPDTEVDMTDPQILWLRRYKEQGNNWLNIWRARFQLVEQAMIDLRENCATHGRQIAAEKHMEWLLSDNITNGTTVPFWQEATAFRAAFDTLIQAYDAAMTRSNQTAVKGKSLA